MTSANPGMEPVVRALRRGRVTVGGATWAVKPSGRLPYSIFKGEAEYGPPIVDSVADPNDPNAWQVDFTEGQMIDYRQFDANGTDPLFEFGFGLSYTTFAMAKNLSVELTSNSSLSALPDKAQGIAPGGIVDLWNIVAAVKVVVTNTGDRAGSVVPQLYLAFPQDTTPAGTPHKVLRGFKKLHLEVGEHREVVFELMRRDLSYWDVDNKQWVIPEGTFGFQAGFSSRDLIATTQHQIRVQM